MLKYDDMLSMFFDFMTDAVYGAVIALIVMRFTNDLMITMIFGCIVGLNHYTRWVVPAIIEDIKNEKRKKQK